MGSADERMQKCLYDIPHTVTMKLIKSLDTDVGWEKLAAASGFSFEDICSLRQEERKSDGSPTRSLLWKLGCQAYTLQMLYTKLSELNRIYDAEIVATYIREGEKRTRPTPAYHASPSKNSDYLSSYLDRMSLASNNPQASMAGGANYYHSPTGSEVNFNNQSMAGTSPMKLAGETKMYVDKLIPGAKVSPVSPLSHMYHGSVVPSFVSNQYSSPSSSSSSDNNNRHHPFASPESPCSPSCMAAGYKSGSPTRVLREVGLPQNNSHNGSAISMLSNQTDAEVAMNLKKKFSYQELASATEGFSQNNILGEGGFGVVYRGQLMDLDCAVKKFVKRISEDKSDSSEQIHSELSALLRYQHENIVMLYGYALDGPQLCLVYQYLSNGSLEDRLIRKNNSAPLSWERRLNILVGSCKAIRFLHTMGSAPLIHGDVKSANILLDNHLEAKLADLGQSRYATSASSNTGSLTHITIAQSTSRQYGSKAYLAPEIKSGCSISIQSDIYAMGVVFLEVCSGLLAHDPFRDGTKSLTDIYANHASQGESVLLQEFQDKTPGDHIDASAFTSLLKLASQCIGEIKKNRPSSAKLLKNVKKTYDGQYKEQSFSKSLNSPTEDDVTVTSTLSNYNSHCRERPVSNELNSPAPQLSPPPPPSHQPQQEMPSFLMMQEERLQQISMRNHHQSQNPQRQLQRQPSVQNSMSSKTSAKVPFATDPSKTYSKFSPAKTKSTQPLKPTYCHQSSTSSCQNQSALQSKLSPSYIQSFSPKQPPPEAYVLQKHYDDKLASGQLIGPNDVATSNANPGLSVSHQTPVAIVSPARNPVEQGDVDEQESDPGKLAAMKVFDLGFRSINTSNPDEPLDISSPVSMKCDEAKLALLNNFDDRLYQANRKTTGGNGSNVKTSLSNCDQYANPIRSGCGGGGGNSTVSQQNTSGASRSEGENSSTQTCYSYNQTNPKEIEAMNSQPSQYNDQANASSDCSSPFCSQETRADSSYYSGSRESKSSTDNHKLGAEGNAPRDESHQQRLANRENLFSYYNAGIDGDDVEECDEDEAREEEYV